MNLSPTCEARLGEAWALLTRLGLLAASRGERVALVGGIPRDLLLDTEPSGDFDLVVEGNAIGLAEAWCNQEGGQLLRHRPFNNAAWKTDDLALDLIQARTEEYPAIAALPEVEPATIEQDLGRRDFRLNAMAITLNPDQLGELLDPHQGLQDLRNHQLQVFHEKSFCDDPTRILRAVRYATRLDLEIGDSCLIALDQAMMSEALALLSMERYGAELHRLLSEKDAARCIECAAGLGAFDRLPIEAFSLYTSAEDCLHVHQIWKSEPIDQAELLWLLFADQLEAPEEWSRLVPGGGEPAKRFSQGTDPIRRALHSCDTSEDPGVHGLALEGLDAVQRAFAQFLAPGHPTLHWWEENGRSIPFEVTGEALLAQGFQPGPEIGQALLRAKQAAWRGSDSGEQLLAALSKNSL